MRSVTSVAKYETGDRSIREPVNGRINDRINAAYRTKYHGSPYLRPMISAGARSATVKVGNQNRAASVIARMRYIAASFIALFLVVGSVHAQRAAQQIEEASFITIGGIEQWVTIRGDDRRKPVLMLLHGGPGDVQSPFVSTYAPYEKDLVLVQWDQRGAGRTFARNGAAGVTRESSVNRIRDLAERHRPVLPDRIRRVRSTIFGLPEAARIDHGSFAEDLEEIWSYVAEEVSPATADRLTEAIIDRFELLAEQPTGGSPPTGFREGVRSFTVENHVI
jgi:hypothetical protein